MKPVWDPRFDEVLRDALPPTADLEPAADLFSLGVSSVRLVGLMVNLELMYDVEFPAEALSYATTPIELWESIQRLVAESRC